MNRLIIISLSALLFFFVSICSAIADLDGFLFELDKKASVDMPAYHSALSKQFNITSQKVDRILKGVDKPADAFMCLQLARMAGRDVDRVFRTYNTNRGKGWGVMAKELGIKPGSPEFHALKQGDFVFFGVDGKNKYNKADKGKDKEKGKDKDKDKGKDKDKDKDKGKAKGRDKNF